MMDPMIVTIDTEFGVAKFSFLIYHETNNFVANIALDNHGNFLEERECNILGVSKMDKMVSGAVILIEYIIYRSIERKSSYFSKNITMYICS